TQDPASLTEELNSFFERNRDVQSIHWVPNYSTANYSDDTHEVKRFVVAGYKVVQSYRLDQESDMAKAATENGELPKTPAHPTSIENPYFEGRQKQEITHEHAAFYARNPEVKHVYWEPDEEAGQESKADRMVVELKSGGLESYR